MKKRVFSIFMTVIMAMSLMSTGAFAAEVDTTKLNVTSGPQGIKPATEEEIARWNATNEETLENAIARRIQEVSVAPAATATWKTISGLTYYGQEKKDSCGAAAVKMLLKALTGTEYTESTIRDGCKYDSNGITIGDSVSYVNSKQSVHSYTAKYSVIHSWFTDNLYEAIATNSAPAIVSIVTTENDGWMYDTGGHALTVYGVKSDKSEYKIADPWGGFVNVSAWEKYEKTDDALFKAYGWTHGYMV